MHKRFTGHQKLVALAFSSDEDIASSQEMVVRPFPYLYVLQLSIHNQTIQTLKLTVHMMQKCPSSNTLGMSNV